jgi:hypothetical protein
MIAVRIHRLSIAFQDLIFQQVKREEERKAETDMEDFRDFKYPTPAELYALEQWAHRERSRALAQLLKTFFSKLFASRGPSADIVQKHAAHHA